jgi:dipeptidyl aminopeptidase/acylaminoacyl peptidase
MMRSAVLFRDRILVVAFVLSTWSVISGVVVAQSENSYQLPPQDVVDIIDAKPVPSVSLSPDRKWMMLIERSSMPGIEDLARRMLRLAGMRIDPVSFGRFTTSFDLGVSVRPLEGDEPVQVKLPAGSKISDTLWSHRSDVFAVITVGERGQQLWLVSVDDPAKPRLLTENLTTLMSGVDWLPDGKSLFCLMIPENHGDEPEAPAKPGGPSIQESFGNLSPVRTYQDLLSNAHDEELFAYFATSQLVEISLTGDIKKIGSPAMYSSVSVSPDENFFLVTKLKKPFSYVLPMNGFPHDIEVLDREGRLVRTIADVPMGENIPIEGVRTGPRNVSWKAGEPATLFWLEALDGGDPNRKVDFRDRLIRWAAPFDVEPTEILKFQHRAMGISTMQDPNLIIATDYDRDRRWIRMQKYNLHSLDQTPQVLVDRSINDRYGDPGMMVSVPDESGFRRILQDGKWVYRIGNGASTQGDLPFLDRQDLETLQTERLWRSSAGSFEMPIAVIPQTGSNKPVVLTSRETRTTPTNIWLCNLESEESMRLTDFHDPTPQIRGIQKQLVTYKRVDGVDLSATLYLPADYQPGTRLPLIVWAYPMEFNDPSTAGQVSGNPDRFVRMMGITHLTLVTQGYAVMDNATMPIVGDPETMNDTFVEQVVSSAQAAIDFAVELGVADRNRVGVGGHSYGAFMTANLLAHSDLFKAGVARSGAYNRTLTPFGFQAERRDFWKAKNIYMNLSPFYHADQISAPILLIHGEDDNNPGTFPLQSQRMFQAIKGTGGSVRLVMLPHESHGYSARESVLHTQAEMIQWFDRFVKNASPN